jgi:hypothetical protein
LSKPIKVNACFKIIGMKPFAFVMKYKIITTRVAALPAKAMSKPLKFARLHKYIY